MNESNGVIRDARKLGIPKMLILGLQHMFAMFGATILVPILVNSYFVDACGEGPTRGLTVAVTLFCAGFGTLLFHVCTKFKVPAFLGSSFAFLSGFSTVAHLDTGMYATMSANDKAAYACGGVVVAGLLYLVLALIIRLVGVKRVMRFLPPVVTGPVIICIGLSLAGSAINNASTNWFLALVALAVIIVFNIWGKGMFKIIPILMGVMISYVVALLMTMAGMTNPDGSAILNFSAIATSGWVGVPPLQICKFDVTAILVMAPIAIATMMEHVGDMSAISATVEENFIANPGLHRTLLGDGLATSMAGFLGGPANTTYGENTGVLELSRVHDPRVIRIAADIRHHRELYPEGICYHQYHAFRYHRRRQLHAVRYDFRHRRAERGREQGRFDQVQKPDYRRRYLCMRTGLQQRHHLHGRRHPDYPDCTGYRSHRRHPAEHDSAGQ